MRNLSLKIVLSCEFGDLDASPCLETVALLESLSPSSSCSSFSVYIPVFSMIHDNVTSVFDF